MPHPQHRKAQRRRGGAAARLKLCVAVLMFVVCAFCGFGMPEAGGQAASTAETKQKQGSSEVVQRRTSAFLRGRSTRPTVSSASTSPAEALANAQQQHLSLLAGQAVPLNATWTAVGPVGVQTSRYGLVTGRITSVALDPGDVSGNTVCRITPQYTDLSATGTVSLTVLTGTSTAKRVPLTATLLLPVLLLPVWVLRRRQLPALFAALLGICACFGMASCGTGRTIADSGSGTSSGGGSGTTGPVTPPGIYAIVASATAAGVTHAVSLTLVVK